MNKEQYMKELEKSLSSLPRQEQEEAMNFYEEYMADMEENNPEMLEALEPPHQIAAQIKADAAMRTTGEKDIQKKKGISTAWTVLLAIFALPIGLPVAITVAVLALALIIVALSLVISLFAVALSVVLSGIGALITAVVMIPTSFAVALFYLGTGLFALGLGYLISIGVYDLSKRMFIWIAKIINNIRLKIQNRQTRKEEVVK